mmetsp:Transcript_19125/g.29312  ORF Transcript_19125/g.29312 Transcript_19125/m.29312 type:complete len:115 (+) Transcript_19125:253-597(+)
MKLQMEFGHSDEEMDNFYLTFKDKFKAYEAKDPESVDILYGFLDLEKFFKQMVDTAKMLSAKVDTNQANAEYKAELQKDAEREKVSVQEYIEMLDKDVEDPANGFTKKIDQPDF